MRFVPLKQLADVLSDPSAIGQHQLTVSPIGVQAVAAFSIVVCEVQMLGKFPV